MATKHGPAIANAVQGEFATICEAAQSLDDPVLLARTATSPLFRFLRVLLSRHVGCDPSQLRDQWVVAVTEAALAGRSMAYTARSPAATETIDAMFAGGGLCRLCRHVLSHSGETPGPPRCRAYAAAPPAVSGGIVPQAPQSDYGDMSVT
jgi:hypothetical protein